MSSDKTTASRPPASSPPERRMVAVFTISHEGSFIQKRSLRRKASFRARRPTKESVRAARGHHDGKMVMVIAARHNPCPHASGATHGFRPSSRQSPFWRSGRGRLTLSDRSAPARGATNPSGRGRTSGTGTPKPGANHKTTLLKRRSPYPALLESWQIPEVVRG